MSVKEYVSVYKEDGTTKSDEELFNELVQEQLNNYESLIKRNKYIRNHSVALIGSTMVSLFGWVVESSYLMTVTLAINILIAISLVVFYIKEKNVGNALIYLLVIVVSVIAIWVHITVAPYSN